MTKKFGPERDALNLDISDVVDEIISLIEERNAANAADAAQESEESKDKAQDNVPAAKPVRKDSVKKTKDGLASIAQGRTWATWQVMGRQTYSTRSLRSNELKSVHALVAWVANEQGAAPETVRAITETRFNVQDVTKLKQKDYDEVIKFLVDLRIDEMRH